MNKYELLTIFSASLSDEQKDAIVEKYAKLMEKNGGKVEISGFGKFEVKAREAREGVNPKTKENITRYLKLLKLLKKGRYKNEICFL